MERGDPAAAQRVRTERGRPAAGGLRLPPPAHRTPGGRGRRVWLEAHRARPGARAGSVEGADPGAGRGSVEDAARVREAGTPVDVVEVDAFDALAARGRVHEGTLAHVDPDVAGLP